MAYGTIAVTPGAGANVGFDTISGTSFQRVKPVWGVEGAAVDVSATNPLPVVDPDVSTYHLVLAAGTNAARIKSGAAKLRSVHAFSKRATPFYIKFHDTNSNPPTAGSGVVFTVGIQATLPRDLVLPGNGRAFASGLGISVVDGIGDTNAVAVESECGVIEVGYV